MPYIDPEWTNEQKALVMADEACVCVVESYNKMVKLLESHPECREFVKTNETTLPMICRDVERG